MRFGRRVAHLVHDDSTARARNLHLRWRYGVWQWLLLSAGVVLLVYVAAVIALVVADRRTDARAVARFVPDCIVLFKRLLGDPRVHRSRKVLPAALMLYLLSPIDLVPDFIPSSASWTTRCSSPWCFAVSCVGAARRCYASIGPGRSRRSGQSGDWRTASRRTRASTAD